MKKVLALLVAIVLCLTCFVACGKKTEDPNNDGSKPTQVVYDVEDAAAYLKNMYKKYLTETETAADYTLVSQVMKGGVVYTIEWSVDREDIKVLADEANKQVKIDLDEKTKVDITYTLTATIKDPDGKTATLTFELKVPKYVLSSWKDYMAAEAGKAVVVEGYIAAVHAPSEGNKYNTLYLHDVNNEGGYYVYSMADSKDLVKDLGLKKGMLVSVTGTKDIYSGTHEIKDASVTVLDTTVKDLKPLDITDTYKNATTLKDKALTDKLGMLVTIKGVEITDQDLSEKSMYLNFKLAGLTTYVRVYATDCPASVTDAGQEKIIADHGKKAGYSADVTGVVVMYSGAIYLNPVSDTPFNYGKKIERTPEQMVEVEMDEVKFDKDVALNKTLTLPLKGKTYEDVVISWVSNNTDYIVIDGDKAKITLGDAATTASITGTFTLGTITKTKTITFNLAKKSSVVAQNAANPVPGTAYKFFMTQLNKGKVLYFNGDLDPQGYYGATTEDPNEAVDVYLEAATGGYYLTFTKGGTKQYITVVAKDVSGSIKYNFAITTDKPVNPFTLDAAYENAPVITIGDEKLFIGSYNDFETMSASKYSYIATNFVAHLGTVVDTSTIKPADKVAAEKNGLTVEADEFFVATEIDLATKGSVYSDVAITWTSNSEYAVVNGNKLTITLPTATTKATLTATIKCGTVTATKTFDITITVVSTEAFAPVFAGYRPEAGKAYKLAIYQAKLGKWLYADGTFGEKYLNTTENYNEGADYYAEPVSTDVYKFYILEGTIKKYLTFYLDASNKTRVKFDAAGSTQFTYDVTTSAWVTNFDGKDCYLGTYSTYDTLSVSETSYINANNTGVEQFPANPAEMKITETPLKADKAYKFAFFQGNSAVNKMLYVNGTVSGRYLGTSANPAEGADVYVEEVTGGFKFYILDGTTKMYIVAYKNGDNKTSLKFDAATSSVFYFNSTTNAWVTTLDGAELYMGTYSNFETVSLSATSYIDADNTGVEQFPLNLVDVKFSGTTGGDQGGNEGGNEGGSTTPTTMPYTVGKEYYLQVNQENNNKLLYITGEMSGNYYATTTNTSESVKVVIEADGAGYQLYYMNGTTKTYLCVVANVTPTKTYYNLAYATTKPTTAWVWDASLGTFTFAVDGNSYFIGTYNSFDTLSACNSTYTTNFKAVFVENATENPGGNEDDDDDNTGNQGGTTPTPTGKTYRFVATKDGTKYYLKNTVTGGRGDITTNASEAAVFYMEQSGDDYYFYWLDGTTKMYYSFKDSNSTSDFQYTTTAYALQAVEVEGVTVYQNATTLRALSLYQTSNMRTYKTSSAQNFNGTNGVPVVLEEIA